MGAAFFRIEIRASDPAEAERLLAEAYAAGAAGCEEREGDGSGKRLLLYVAGGRVEAVGRVLRAAAVDSEIGGAEPVEARDWSQAWREGLDAIVISPRLVVRPPFVEHAAGPGQRTVVIDPGQAFGTGEHESTRLALELLDAAMARLAPRPRVLDVGTGSGVLAIAAAKLGARGAVGLDLDPVASAAARGNARRNDVAGCVGILTGPVGAVAGRFELVVTNLLRRELTPILGEIAARTAPGALAVLTGLLAADREAVEKALAERGLALDEVRERTDARGDRWIGLLARAG